MLKPWIVRISNLFKLGDTLKNLRKSDFEDYKYFLQIFRIHEKLMTQQLAELEALKEFLTGTEDRISRMGPLALHDLNVLEEQMKEQQQLHEDIIKQQERVVAFSNLVVVVDENNPDADFSNMEDQLAALSERWSHICSLTEKRGKLISQLKAAVPIYLQKHKDLEEWLQAQEKKLKEVEANPNDSSEDSLMERYEKLQVFNSVTRHVCSLTL